MNKPNPKDYGYETPSIYEEGGWMLEGGEEAYYDALDNWKNVKQEELDLALSFYFLNNNEEL